MKSAQLMHDMQGILRGLALIRASQASLPVQRAILPTRRVSQAQRDALEKEQAKRAFLERERAD